MEDQELARFVGVAADAAARRSKAFRRGNVDRFHGDGRLVVTLPNGGKILSQQSRISPLSPGQSSLLLGQTLSALAPSPYGGGKGAPFTPPDP